MKRNKLSEEKNAKCTAQGERSTRKWNGAKLCVQGDKQIFKKPDVPGQPPKPQRKPALKFPPQKRSSR
ncbi:hypothetical protein ACQP3C_27570, partial [Escherichia coli]